MTPAFSIDHDTGTIRIGDIALLVSNQRQATVESQVCDLISESQDHGNGYEWLHLKEISFGGQPAHLSLCFHDGLLEQASWSIRLPGSSTERGWPTRDAIDAEISFVRRTLVGEMGIDVGQFSWGEVWSAFDAKGFMAANGLRYRRA